VVFEPNDKQSLTARVYDYIRNGILDGTYKDGDYLVETRLADELQVSRTPIREALKQLELEGLAMSMPNRGVVVKAISQSDTDDMYNIRQILEGLAASWAAQRRTQEQLDALSEKIDFMDFYTGRGGAEQLSRLDNEFHELIYKACDSRMLRHILASLHQNTRRARTSSLTIPSRPHDSLNEHKAVFAAIKAGDPEAAKEAMENHVKNAHTATM